MPYGFPSFYAGAMPGADMPGSTVDPVSPSPQDYVSDYASGLLGMGPMEFDSEGRYGITEEDRRRAGLGAVRTVLTGLTQSLLSKDPSRIANAAAAAGDTYQASLDKASARNVTNRTMQFQEARAKVELVGGLNQLEKDKLAIADMERRAQEDDELRQITGDVADMALADLKNDIDEEVKAGRIDSEAAKVMLRKGQLASSLIRTGRGDEANKYMTELYQDMPAQVAEKTAARLQSGVYAKQAFEKANPGLTIDDQGNIVDKAELEKAKQVKDTKDKLSIEGAQVDIARGRADLDRIRAEIANPKPTRADQDEAKRTRDLVSLSNNIVGLVRGAPKRGEMGHSESEESMKKPLEQLREITGMDDKTNRAAINWILDQGGQSADIFKIISGIDAGDPEAISAYNQIIQSLNKPGSAAPGSTRNPSVSPSGRPISVR